MNEKELYTKEELLKVWHYYIRRMKTKVFIDNIFLKYWNSKIQISLKELQWFDTIVLMDVEFIHKPRKNNLVPNTLNKKDEYMTLKVLIMIQRVEAVEEIFLQEVR